MPPPSEHISLTPEDRFREVARLLAIGLLRRRRAEAAAEDGQQADPENCSKSAQDCLELSAESRLTVHSG